MDDSGRFCLTDIVALPLACSDDFLDSVSEFSVDSPHSEHDEWEQKESKS